MPERDETRWQLRVALVVSLVCASLVSLPGAAQQKKRPATKPKATAAKPAPVREKVAEGRYELKKPDGKVAQITGEPWTLFRTNVGFELEEQWLVSKDTQAPPTIIAVGVNFAPGLYPIQVRIGGVGSAKELRCSMEAKEFACDSGGLHSSVAMQGPYNLYLPSPWMLGSIARRAKKIPDKSTRLQLVQMVGMSDAGPKLESFEAEVQYIGEDEVAIEGTKIPASIFEVKAKKMPSVLIWLSPEGIVLAMQGSSKTEQRIELVKFTKFAKF